MIAVWCTGNERSNFHRLPVFPELTDPGAIKILPAAPDSMNRRQWFSDFCPEAWAVKDGDDIGRQMDLLLHVLWYTPFY